MKGIVDKRDRAGLFRDRLARAMAEKGVTQSGLARDAGVDRSTISQLLSGEGARLPNAQLVAECAAALAVSADWLLGLTERPERLAELLATSLTMTEAPRALIDETIFGWHQEAAGYKIRHVPATLPDMLKTRAMLRWEYEPQLGRTAEQAIGASEDRLAWMARSGSDYEMAVALHELEAFARAEGYYRGQSIWMRHSDGAGGFGEPTEMTATDADAPMLVVTPAPSQYRFEVNGDVVSPASVAIRVTCDDCGDLTWDVNCDAGWVTMHEQDDQLILSVDAAALAPSEYSTTVQILVPDSPDIAPVALAVDVVVVEADPQDDPQRQDDPTIAPLLPEHLVYLPYTMRR